MISREFGMDARTIGKRLAAAELTGDTFNTGQIMAAMNGDMDAEKLGLIRAQRIHQEMDNQISIGQLVNAAELAQHIGKFLSAARQRILSNLKLDEDEKDKILRELGQCLDSVGEVPGADSTDIQSPS